MRRAALYLAVLSLGLAAVAAEAQADSFSYFFDGSYVDTGSEAASMRAELVGLGHTPLNFTGTSDAAWSTALAAADCLVIPELDTGNLIAALSATTRTAIANFVSGGGGLIFTGTNRGSSPDYDVGFLNTVFGWSLVDGTDTASGTSSLNAANAAGTAFAGGPASVSSLNGTFFVTSASLPVGALAMYEGDGSLSGNTSVFQAGFGSGSVTYIAYDWFSGQDADWASVLGAAMAAKTSAVPEPGTLALLALGVGGLGAARRRKKQRNAA